MTPNQLQKYRMNTLKGTAVMVVTRKCHRCLKHKGSGGSKIINGKFICKACCEKLRSVACEVCGKSWFDGAVLIRQNKGEVPARWLCVEHHTDLKSL